MGIPITTERNTLLATLTKITPVKAVYFIALEPELLETDNFSKTRKTISEHRDSNDGQAKSHYN